MHGFPQKVGGGPRHPAFLAHMDLKIVTKHFFSVGNQKLGVIQNVTTKLTEVNNSLHE